MEFKIWHSKGIPNWKTLSKWKSNNAPDEKIFPKFWSKNKILNVSINDLDEMTRKYYKLLKRELLWSFPNMVLLMILILSKNGQTFRKIITNILTYYSNLLNYKNMLLAEEMFLHFMKIVNSFMTEFPIT